MFKSLLEDLASNIDNEWAGAKYEKMKHLSINDRGRFGEMIVLSVLKHIYPKSVFWYDNGIQGDFDLKMDDIRIEVKTATKDKKGKFQHENVKNYGYDCIFFVDVSPNDIRFKIYNINNIPFDKLHSRKKAETGANFKWDFNSKGYNTFLESNDVVLYDVIKNEWEKAIINENY